ncbi:UDP-glucose 4-epimerase GalE [Undibacterium squillarum]|uniref:UDP-glucose 4-epimerase n=1 Tax=Undibacterium squillarum TaxID=1131567 RepID=A0ABQ2XVR1_9BURK|nr:UDP-glucose 4-epimerase GalE [Undibacterium squillarum]GGX36567.1 UDP-glucose 4-epimerase [Undibacterium squillarum]
MNILVTGGTGYIASHTCIALAEAGHVVTIVDNFSNSNPEVVDRIARITGHYPRLVYGDINDPPFLNELFQKIPLHAVFHFAGKKAVGESMQLPLYYYQNNVTASVVLLDAMQRHGVKTLIFSSSATVYSPADAGGARENMLLAPQNPYGCSKAMVEQILDSVHHADPSWNIVRLRYFNPAGAHPSGRMGESPEGAPQNLMPYLCQIAEGKKTCLPVFGDDYPTRDGTGIRDYVHVMDLASGHVAALDFLNEHGGNHVFNLGSGHGYSVLEMIHAFEKVSGLQIPVQIHARRPGDLAASWADCSKAQNLLKWQVQFGLDEICKDAWKWSRLRELPLAGSTDLKRMPVTVYAPWRH